jgi:alkylhydroperoxidase/carboxymuconolactone decarboxylase family protein YurZ
MLNSIQLNPQLKGHLKGALNHGATIEDVQAVRDAVINICIASGMRRVADNEHGTGGWRSEVADLK